MDLGAGLSRGGAQPRRILAVNVGSSSLKLRVLDQSGAIVASSDRTSRGSEAELEEAFEAILAQGSPIDAAGHRVVHGGPHFTGPVVLSGEIEAVLERLTDLAPLHNPPAIAAIRTLEGLRPKLPAVACFDTAFHTTLPAVAATYAVPKSWSEGWELRRYGFHGLSHAYCSRRAAALLGRPLAELRLVTAHLGAGASLAAVRGGKSVETTMGFTPMEGLVMATRSGSIDPGLLLWVQRRGHISAEEMEQELEREAGLFGLSGHSDMREILAGIDAGDCGCQLALDVYVHHLVAAVAAMTAAMGGIDALVFTGGIGEHASRVRADSCQALAFLGIALDQKANAETHGDGLLTRPGAGTAVVLVSAREDLEIAAQVRATLYPA